MLYATTAAGTDTEPSPRATGTCPLCGGPVLAKCGQINAWHWAHQAGQDCDPWNEPLTDWHRAYQRLVPAERCEVVIGQHRADILAPKGNVIELQHSTISSDEIAAREAHYGRGMVWLFDAREAYERQRLTLRRKDDNDYVTFRWKQARRAILACKRTLLLDLGQGIVLSVKKKYDGPPVRGWGHVFRTTDVWSWLRDGTKPEPIEWTGDQYEDLVNRIVQAAIYLRHNPPSSAPTSPGSETSRIMKAMLFAGDNPRTEMRSALAEANTPSLDLQQLHDHIGLHGRWDTPGRLTLTCWCGGEHRLPLGPEDWTEFEAWSTRQTWPQTISIRCPRKRDRSQTLTIPKPPSTSNWWGELARQ